MALSFDAVKEAYKVCDEMGVFCSTLPQNFKALPIWESIRPSEKQLYGVGQKSDGGWEELFFFIKNPSPEFIQKWNELKTKVPNSSFENTYENEYTILGWF